MSHFPNNVRCCYLKKVKTKAKVIVIIYFRIHSFSLSYSENNEDIGVDQQYKF